MLEAIDFVSNADVRATARAYQTEPEFFPGGHNMMLEPGWASVAERIHVWLQTRDLDHRNVSGRI